MTAPIERCDWIWDDTAALARVDGDVPFLMEIIELFVAGCPKLIADLEGAVSAGDATSIKKSAHAIKGNAATLCAGAAFETALILETKGKNGDLHGVAQDCQELKTRLRDTHLAMVRFMENGRPQEEGTALDPVSHRSQWMTNSRAPRIPVTNERHQYLASSPRTADFEPIKRGDGNPSP